MSDGDFRLMGAACHSKSGYCQTCNRPIINTSRTRPKARCEPCSKSHVAKINKMSAERTKRLAKEKRKAARKQA